MLDDLVQTIEDLKKRIRDHRDDIQGYESRTRVTLIDPMLCALGWDVSSPSVVTIEPKGPGGWADYALLGGNGRTIVIFVEAKKLADRDAPITQTVGYAVAENIQNNANVRYCASTNGDTWELYDIIAQTSVMKTSIVVDDAATCALKLLGLWRRSMVDGTYTAPVEPVTSTPEPIVPVESGGPVPEPERDDSASQHPLTPGWTPLTAEFATIGSPPPAMVKLPNGQEITTKYWIHILIESAKWLHQSGMLTSENFSMSMSDLKQTKSYLLSPNGWHTGRAFRNSEKIAEGIFLECNLSSREIVHQTQRLLRRFNQDPSRAYLKGVV